MQAQFFRIFSIFLIYWLVNDIPGLWGRIDFVGAWVGHVWERAGTETVTNARALEASPMNTGMPKEPVWSLGPAPRRRWEMAVARGENWEELLTRAIQGANHAQRQTRSVDHRWLPKESFQDLVLVLGGVVVNVVRRRRWFSSRVSTLLLLGPPCAQLIRRWLHTKSKRGRGCARTTMNFLVPPAISKSPGDEIRRRVPHRPLI